MLPQGIQDPDLWGPISRSTVLVGLERDRGWGAVQNCYPIAMEPLDGRNAATVERLFSRPPPVAGGPARRGGRALGAAEGDDVATVVMVEPLRVGNAMLCI